MSTTSSSTNRSPSSPVRRTIRLSASQAEYRAATALYRGFIGGVGSGKSWVGAYDLIRRAKPGRTYMVGSPTGVLMGDTTYPTFKAIAEDLKVVRTIKLSPYPNVTLTNGAVVRFRTAENPDRMRGPNLSGVWLDEASLMHHDAYKVSIARLREGGEQGWLGATYTPKGPLSWTAEVFAAGKPNTHVVKAGTWSNPFNPPEYYLNLKEQFGDTLYARQELEGDLVQLEGAEFPAEWFTHGSIAADDPASLWFDDWPDDLAVKVIALDPSKGTDGQGDDDQAHALVGLRAEGTRWRVYVDAHLERVGVVDMVRRTMSLARQFQSGGRGVDLVVVEDNATMGLFPPVIEQVAVEAKLYLPWQFRPSTLDKEFRIRYQLAPPLSRRSVRIRRTPGGKKLLAQIQAFPHGDHDDGVDALSLGMRLAAELTGPPV